MSRQLRELLASSGLELVRERRHLVFRHIPSNRIFVCSKTPSSHFFERQVRASLRRFLRANGGI
jgi:hypothetical protein